MSCHDSAADLVLLLMKAPRTVQELSRVTRMQAQAVRCYVKAFHAQGLVYVHGRKKEREGGNYPSLYAWNPDPETIVPDSHEVLQ